MRARSGGLAVLGVGILALLGACTAPAPATPTDPAPAAPTHGGSLTVFAAASLKAPFEEIGAAFEAERGAEVAFSFEGSSTLVDQLAGGAPADVFASADEKNMTRALDQGLVAGTPSLFATNQLVLVVPAGNPGAITGLDSSLDGKRLVVCAVGVPCGNATAQLAETLGVALHPVSEEQNVTDVRGKVESGEADAGFVYATDAKLSGDKVEVVPVPGAEQVVNRYPIAVTAEASDPAVAQQFVDAVTSPQGQAVLASYGFGTP